MATRGAPGPFSISQLFPPSLALYLSFTTLGHSGTACERQPGTLALSCIYPSYTLEL